MKIHITVSGLDLTSELEKYANVKIARLSRRVPKGLRASASCTVHFSQVRKKGAKFNTCIVSFELDGAELKSEETTLHMYSALDVAAVHLEKQLVDFAAQQGGRSLRSRLRRYFRPN